MYNDLPAGYLNSIVVGVAQKLLRTLPDASIPLFLFSPPYNLGNAAGGSSVYKSHYPKSAALGFRGGNGRKGMGKKGGRWDGGALSGGYDDFDDNLPHPEYVAWQNDILRECWRCLTPAGAIFYNHKPRILDGVLVAPVDYVPSDPDPTKDLRRHVRQEIIWARSGGVNATPAFYMSTHERIVIIARPGWRLRSQSASAVGDVWRIHQEASTWHPAPFPLSLALRVLETTAAPLVCDPFMGSGTTGKAARTLGVDFIGFDRNATYAARAMAEIALIQPLPFAPEEQQAVLIA